MGEAPKCTKPGCGAMLLIGKPCTDWDCPQIWVHYTGFNASVEDARRQGFDAAREKAAKIAEGNYDHIGVEKKQDKCPHGQFEWEDCDQCVAAAIRAMEDDGK